MTNNNKATIITRNWHHIDASGKVLGRLATEVAVLLHGKHKINFRRHIDMGDIVVITNASKVVVTGNKETDKFYYNHSGYPGGLKTTNVAKLRQTYPERIIIKAVTGMLPKTLLRDVYLKRLKVYPDSEHPHIANLPTKTVQHKGHS